MTTPEKTPDQRLKEVYSELDKTSLENDVKIAVKAILLIRQAINWATVEEEERKGKVDATIVKYIRASSAKELPELINDVLNKLPFDLIFRHSLGEFAIDIYPNVQANRSTKTEWERALVRVKQETIPLFLISKKFYQDTEVVS